MEDWSGLEKKRLRGCLILLQLGEEGKWKGRSSLVHSDGTCGNGLELYQRRLRVDYRKRFFTERVVKHQNKRPGEVVKCPNPDSV